MDRQWFNTVHVAKARQVRQGPSPKPPFLTLVYPSRLVSHLRPNAFFRLSVVSGAAQGRRRVHGNGRGEVRRGHNSPPLPHPPPSSLRREPPRLLTAPPTNLPLSLSGHREEEEGSGKRSRLRLSIGRRLAERFPALRTHLWPNAEDTPQDEHATRYAHCHPSTSRLEGRQDGTGWPAWWALGLRSRPFPLVCVPQRRVVGEREQQREQQHWKQQQQQHHVVLRAAHAGVDPAGPAADARGQRLGGRGGRGC